MFSQEREAELPMQFVPKKRGKWLLSLLFIGILTVAGILSTYLSPVFRVKYMEIAAPANFDPVQIEQIADLEGESMFSAPLTEAEARLEAQPLVRDARIERLWPQKVRITVEPRVAWGYWQVGDQYYVVDDEGVIMSQGASIGAAPAIIQTDGSADLSAGSAVDVDAVRTADTLMAVIPGRFNMNVVYFEYGRATGLSVVVDGGYSVVFGDGHDLDYQLSVWQSVEEEIGRKQMQGHVLDLRFGDRPSLRRP